MSDLAWHRGPLLAWDLETTGPNPDTARIVTATIIEIGREGIERTTEWLVNPGIPIPLGASEIHGITTERAVRDGQDPEPAVFEIMAQIGLWMGRGRPALAFNASYDFTVLDRECRRYRIDTLSRRMGDVAPVIDPYVIDKHVDRYRKGKRTVTAMAEHYGAFSARPTPLRSSTRTGRSTRCRRTGRPTWSTSRTRRPRHEHRREGGGRGRSQRDGRLPTAGSCGLPWHSARRSRWTDDPRRVHCQGGR
jgi:hypothetical protein